MHRILFSEFTRYKENMNLQLQLVTTFNNMWEETAWKSNHQEKQVER